MKDIILSIKGVLYERISSPLYGAFILSFMVFNWKIPIGIFFGNASTDQRISIVEEAIFEASIWKLLYYPLISALFVTCLLPAATTLVLWVWEKWQKLAREVVESFEKQKRLTIEQSNELRSQIEEIQDRFNRLLQQKDAQITNLTNQNQNNEQTSPEQMNEEQVQEEKGQIEAERGKKIEETQKEKGPLGISFLVNDVNRTGKIGEGEVVLKHKKKEQKEERKLLDKKTVQSQRSEAEESINSRNKSKFQEKNQLDIEKSINNLSDEQYHFLSIVYKYSTDINYSYYWGKQVRALGVRKDGYLIDQNKNPTKINIILQFFNTDTYVSINYEQKIEEIIYSLSPIYLKIYPTTQNDPKYIFGLTKAGKDMIEMGK